MDVAAGHGEDRRGHAALRALDAAGVVAAGDAALELPGDVLLPGDVAQAGKEPRMGDGGAVHEA